MSISQPHYKRVKRFNIPGHVHFLTFSCNERRPMLSNEIWRTWLGESVRKACDTLDYALWAYVFMPEHVHLLVRPTNENYEISKFLYCVKKPVANRIILRLKTDNSPLLKLLEVNAYGKRGHHFWLPGGGFDGNIWNWEKVIEKARYCHRNPVKRRLVKSPEQWRWSSFRWIELGHRDNEPLRVDDWVDG